MPFHISTAVNSAEKIVNGAIALLPNIGLAIVVFILFVLAGSLAKSLIRRSTSKHLRSGPALLLGRAGQLVLVILGILVGFSIAAPSFRAGDLIKVLGIGTVAIGFAFQNILQNFFAGILLLVSEPFEIGDFISVTGIEGTVNDIEARATIIRTKEGRKVVIPNATLFTNPVAVQHGNGAGKQASNQSGPPPTEKQPASSQTTGPKAEARREEAPSQQEGRSKESPDQPERPSEEKREEHSPRARKFFSW